MHAAQLREIVVVVDDEFEVLLSARSQIIRVFHRRAGCRAGVFGTYELASARRIELFVSDRAVRKVLRLRARVAIDLGAAPTRSQALVEARELGRLAYRPVHLLEADHRDRYFAESPPLLYAYGDGPDEAELPDAPIHRFQWDAPLTGDDDPTEV